ncbi:MAG TPA: hypothetical protein VG714_07360 [Acidobacteriaceae bacterium]|nr:hypothetical protein [Acidobacteriaceae bacterium]
MTARCTLDCAAFGVPFRLDAESPKLLAAIRECVPWGTAFLAPSDRERADTITAFTLPRAILSSNHRAALDTLTRDLMTHVADHAPHHVFVHAGVVASHGRALLLPGATFAGKTTLVAELVRAGAVYYSDEYAVLDSTGLVHPYPRPLAMRAPGGNEQSPTPVDQLGGITGAEPIPAALVVFTRYAEDASWQPEPVSPGMAALEMLRHAIPVQRAPARVMAAFARMLQSAAAFQSPRGDAATTAQLLLAMLEARA